MALVTQEIPLNAGPQRMTVQLGPLFQRRLRLHYADVPEAGWLLDIGLVDGTPVLCGLPLLPGQDLLAQYAYLGLGGQLYVTSDANPDGPIAYEEAGSSMHLYFVYDDGT